MTHRWTDNGKELRMKPLGQLPEKKVLFRIAVCVLVIAVGFVGMQTLAGMKKPPAEVVQKEQALKVRVERVFPEDVPVFISGYGEARVVNEVSISAEVSGRLVEVHPDAVAGAQVEIGDLLFRIDDRDYRAAYEEAMAAVRQMENTILRLEKQWGVDRDRLKTLERNRDLAEAEYLRLKGLYEKDSVGTRTGVEAAEQKWNAAVDQVAQMDEALILYPIQIQEKRHGLEGAKARLQMASTRLERCTVTAPFTARIKSVNLEPGQYVSPGMELVRLADDSVLEIQVSLDSRDARRWLRFEQGTVASRSAWFDKLRPVRCEIRWTETPGGQVWQGRLDRVVRFNEQTRTLTVAVRITGSDVVPLSGGLPLVEGMFCRVRIPGIVLQGVYRLPRWTVSFEDTVFVAEERRLKTVAVKVARIQGEETLISDGLRPGDTVVTTRLVDPLENALLEMVPEGDEESSS
jgi:RND family efflux transporter MFP subunit